MFLLLLHENTEFARVFHKVKLADINPLNYFSERNKYDIRRQEVHSEKTTVVSWSITGVFNETILVGNFQLGSR